MEDSVKLTEGERLTNDQINRLRMSQNKSLEVLRMFQSKTSNYETKIIEYQQKIKALHDENEKLKHKIIAQAKMIGLASAPASAPAPVPMPVPVPVLAAAPAPGPTIPSVERITKVVEDVKALKLR